MTTDVKYRTVTVKWKEFIDYCKELLTINKFDKPCDYNILLNEIHALYKKLKHPFITNDIKYKYKKIIDECLNSKEFIATNISYWYFDESNIRSFTKRHLKFKTPLGGSDPYTLEEKGKRPYVGPFHINGRDCYLPARTIRNQKQLTKKELFVFKDKKTALFLDDPVYPLEPDKKTKKSLNKYDSINLSEAVQNKSKIIENVKNIKINLIWSIKKKKKHRGKPMLL